MKDFLTRNTALITGLFVVSLFAVLVLIFVLISTKASYNETLQRLDQLPVTNLPGPNSQISQRSRDEINTLLFETPHVIGGWIAKLHYEKKEVPLVHTWARNRIIIEAMETYTQLQLSGKGFSSAELNQQSPQSMRNADEAKSGLIKCGPLESSNLPKLAPRILGEAGTVCRATIPPFSDEVNLALVVVTDNEVDEHSPEIQAIRRTMLRIQIDIFNRDYQGRETWARSLDRSPTAE